MMAYSQPLPSANMTIYNGFKRLKEAFDTDQSHSEFRIWSGRFNNFMDKIRNYTGMISQGNICGVLSTCNGYGQWVATNIILRYYENESVDLWIEDVKNRIRRAQEVRIAASRHADAQRVAVAARGRGRGRQGVIVRGVGGVMAVKRRRRGRRGRGRGRGRERVARNPSGTVIFLYSLLQEIFSQSLFCILSIFSSPKCDHKRENIVYEQTANVRNRRWSLLLSECNYTFWLESIIR